ncbi:MAG: homocysteine S-methyltransferase family protein [Deltaproteobacteria bacterium]|nr:homocysteine S-methyltransferase family protein [Deltaproteobacteria bacterium]NNK08445.1 homocysteine S-methyltransferase family protein [Myxococcales bacterium]MBT8466277.1 homocysteine S-methyltransferase family protein [Deltaproteobacteria bacterium]MBT8483576.1 homocysteine S-methyltransferase family protein [Deltaproteobacteria bacterium]NNK43358.1 homocysteine S-methyltransferase family protein [Myxococcales bacterium]
MALQILDGAIGTELASRGLRLDAPQWSARAIGEAPKVLTEVHAAYAEAGATLHTANTFRTQPRAFGDGWLDALRDAVRIARDAVGPGQAVLGSMAPVEDCYRPDSSPGKAARAEHRQVASALADAGCDVLLCETFAHGDEALVAVEEGMATGVPVWLALTAGPFGELGTPEQLARIGRDAVSVGIDRLLVNCIAATRIAAYVDAIARLGAPTGVYANAGGEDEALGWAATSPRAADAYAALAERWKEAGASVIGGCCGTGPLHIQALADRFI